MIVLCFIFVFDQWRKVVGVEKKKTTYSLHFMTKCQRADDPYGMTEFRDIVLSISSLQKIKYFGWYKIFRFFFTNDVSKHLAWEKNISSVVFCNISF